MMLMVVVVVLIMDASFDMDTIDLPGLELDRLGAISLIAEKKLKKTSFIAT